MVACNTAQVEAFLLQLRFNSVLVLTTSDFDQVFSCVEILGSSDIKALALEDLSTEVLWVLESWDITPEGFRALAL